MVSPAESGQNRQDWTADRLGRRSDEAIVFQVAASRIPILDLGLRYWSGTGHSTCTATGIYTTGWVGSFVSARIWNW